MIEYITGAGEEGNTVLEKFLLNVRTQPVAFVLLLVLDPSHFLGQLHVDFKTGTIPEIQGGNYVFVVRHQFVPLPYELDVGSFSVVRCVQVWVQNHCRFVAVRRKTPWIS